MPYSTSQRIFLLSTPLGEDALLIQEFEGHECLSRPFEFKLTVVSERDDIAADELIGKRVTLRIETADDERHWTGMVSSFERIGECADPGADGERLTSYRCEVVPWLWFLSLQEDTRVFQNQSIPEIVETLLGDFQFSDYEMQINGDYPPLTYCTQYNETSFDFISRLLERAGIYYYVAYQPEAEKLIFTDHKDGHPKLDNDRIRFAQERLTEEEDTISALGHRQHMRSGKVTLRDYNFETPTDPMEVTIDSLVRIGDNAGYEIYDYPGDYAQRNDGEARARLLMEIQEAQHEILDGHGNVRTLVPGYRFELAENPQQALNGEYMITSVSHRGSNNIGGDGAPSSYSNAFSCIPQQVLYREPQRTRKPRVAGVQTAIVTGPSGEEIYTDEYGRVKVQFQWDRLGRHDDKSSCWVRVAQAHAGGRWGGMILPRIGEEVLVAFEHGDPDRPVIIGSLYNAINMPPYALPAEATKSVLLKSNSSKGGGGCNEIRIEDKAGSEEMFLQAQKDLQIRVKHNSSTSVGANQSLTVGGDRTEHVAKEHHLVVDEFHLTDVGRDAHLNVGMNAMLATGQSLHIATGLDTSLDAGTEIHIKAGVNIVLDAGVQISLKAGGSSITIGPAGVTLDGPLVRINSGGSPLSAKKADKADKAKKAAEAISAGAGKVSDPGQQAQAAALRKAAAAAVPFCAECEAARKQYQAMQGNAVATGDSVAKAGTTSKGSSAASGGSTTKGDSVTSANSSAKGDW